MTKAYIIGKTAEREAADGRQDGDKNGWQSRGTIKRKTDGIGFGRSLGGGMLVEGEKERIIQAGYVCDLLSWAMARLPEGAAWMTVMGNLNAVAVCSLKDGACIVLTDSAPLDENARARAEIEEIPILRVEAGAYETALRLGELLMKTP